MALQHLDLHRFVAVRVVDTHRAGDAWGEAVNGVLDFLWNCTTSGCPRNPQGAGDGLRQGADPAGGLKPRK
jgi:hypothetical protein